MNQEMTTKNRERDRASSRRGLGMALTILVVLALMTTAAFAYSGSDVSDEAKTEASAGAVGEDIEKSQVHPSAS